LKIYELAFVPSALKEWQKLGSTLKGQFTKKLSERMQNPHVPKDRISGGTNLYKIKLRSSGYRLAYEVDDHVITVFVLSVGKRERSEVYKKALERHTE
jgi:mRNA interferase RelE/StbE